MLFSDNVSTIYIPERHAEHDPQFIAAFLETYSFAMVITTHGGLQISNVPTLLENGNTLLWHLALPLVTMTLIFSLLTWRTILEAASLGLVLGLGAGALAAWRLVRLPPLVLWGRAG